MTDHGSTGIGWKIAFIVLLTAVIAAGATYLLLEAQRPAPVAVTEAPAPVSGEQPPASSIPQATPDSAGSGGDDIELPPLSGDDLASQRFREVLDNSQSSRQPAAPAPGADTGTASTPAPAAPAPRVQATREALANGELQRAVAMLGELEASDAWDGSGEIKVLEEDILARLETAETTLSAEQRQRIQEALTLLGFDTRGVDGIFGRGTRSAIRDYQEARSERPTGYLTEVQLNQLLTQANERGRQLAEQQQNQIQQRESQVLRLRDEAEQLLQAGNLETALAVVREGLDLDPDSAELVALHENIDVRLGEANLNLGETERQRIQRTLTQLGYNARDAEGEFGRATRSAIAAYQRAIGQPSTGYLTEPLLERLLRDAERTNQDAVLQEQERLAELKADTRDLLARADPYRDEAVLRQQLATVVEALDRHPQDQTLLGQELALRARLEEVGLGLSPEQRQAVQRDLSRLGFDTRGTDGHLGPGTREAVTAYQRSRGMANTGYLSTPLLERLWQDAQALPGGATTATTATAEEPPRQFPANDPREMLDVLERELRNIQEQATGGRRGAPQPAPGGADGGIPRTAPDAGQVSGQPLVPRQVGDTGSAVLEAVRRSQAAQRDVEAGEATVPLPTPELQSVPPRRRQTDGNANGSQ